jgi:alkylhydroperoxidase family enzyme
MLRKQGPRETVKHVHANYGLHDPLCEPLLQMLHAGGISRREAHLGVLGKALKLLLDWIKDAPKQQQGSAPQSMEEIELQLKLEGLLQASFKFLGVRELRQVRCSSSCSSDCCATAAAAAAAAAAKPGQTLTLAAVVLSLSP